MSTTPPFTSIAEVVDMMEKGFLDNCTLCGQCLTNCPVYLNPKFGLTEKGPEAVMGKIVDLIKGGPASSEAYIMTYGCTTGCTKICGGACSQGLDLLAMVLAASHRLQVAGKGLPPRAYQYVPGHRYIFGHVFGDLQIKESEVPWLKEVPEQPEPVDVVLFNSCKVHGHPNFTLEAIDILSRMGVNFVTLGDRNLCCSAINLVLGDIEGTQTMAQSYLSAMTKFSPKKVVSICDGCAFWGSAFLPLCFSVPFEAQSLIEFLADNLDKLQFTRQIDKVVTIHDSCGQQKRGRHDAPRKLLQAIPGINLVDMEHNQENNLCCGGLTEWNYPGTRTHMRSAIAEEARAVCADIMATICTSCQLFLCTIEDQYPFEVKYIVSLVAEAMGIYHEDKLKKYLLMRDVNKVMDEARDCIEDSDLSLQEFEQILPAYFDLFVGQQNMPPRNK